MNQVLVISNLRQLPRLGSRTTWKTSAGFLLGVLPSAPPPTSAGFTWWESCHSQAVVPNFHFMFKTVPSKETCVYFTKKIKKIALMVISNYFQWIKFWWSATSVCRQGCDREQLEKRLRDSCWGFCRRRHRQLRQGLPNENRVAAHHRPSPELPL